MKFLSKLKLLDMGEQLHYFDSSKQMHSLLYILKTSGF